MKNLIHLLLISLLIFNCTREKSPLSPEDNTPVGEGEIYSVYSMVTNKMFIWENTKQVVVRDSTVTHNIDAQSEYLTEHLPQLDAALIADFNNQNTKRKPLKKIPGLNAHCALFSDAEMEEIFNGGGWWPEFYKRYPKSSGLTDFSSVGFSNDGKTALLYASSMQGGLAGAGYMILLEKTDQWHIVKSLMLWIS